MAQESVVKEPFTQEMRTAGEKLTRLLDTAGLNIVASFWWYYSESGQWRLILASPLVDSKGPRSVYTKIQSALSAEHDESTRLGLESISVLSPDHDIVRVLGMLVQTGPGIAGSRFTANYVNNVYVDDAYVYRSNRSQPSQPLTKRGR